MNPHASESAPHQSTKLEDACVSTSEGEEDGFTSSDCSSDAETDQGKTPFRSPPGLTLPPWRCGFDKTRAHDSSSDDDSDRDRKQTAAPWRRCVKSTSTQAV